MTVLVVAAALVRDGGVLAARRSAPHPLAGGWEFPGGKVELGEDEPTALIRECREELGVEIAVGMRLGSADEGALRIVLYAAVLTAGEPEPLEDHDALRWLSEAELDSVPWLPIDAALVPRARGLLHESIRQGRL